MSSGSSPPPSFAAKYTLCLCPNVIPWPLQFRLSHHRVPSVALTSLLLQTLMRTTILSCHQLNTPLFPHLKWLLGLQPTTNPPFQNLCMMLYLSRNFLQFLQPLSQHPAFHPLLRFLLLHHHHPNLLLSFLQEGLATNAMHRFCTIQTGT